MGIYLRKLNHMPGKTNMLILKISKIKGAGIFNLYIEKPGTISQRWVNRNPTQLGDIKLSPYMPSGQFITIHYKSGYRSGRNTDTAGLCNNEQAVIPGIRPAAVK